MSKVITFTQRFLCHHPRHGQRTHFVEAIRNSMNPYISYLEYLEKLVRLNAKALSRNKLTIQDIQRFLSSLNWNYSAESKRHTIRSGFRFKPGDKFSPRVWSGTPYQSPQIIFWDDIVIPKIYTIKIKTKPKFGFTAHDHIDNRTSKYSEALANLIASNDGLSTEDFKAWFNKPMSGQIICMGISIPHYC